MNVSTAVVLIASVVALGALARPLATRLRLPSSILLALGGATLGFASLYSIAHPGTLLPVDFAETITRLPIGSSLILYVFLPTLLFESALVVDIHRVREDLLPIVLLALVAVVVATFGVALALWPISGMPLIACLLLGSLVATTDPVAVIAIFRDVGAPERLTRLVEGESLFNDAAAIALFLIFSAAVAVPDSLSLSTAAAEFLVLPIGGAVLGFATASAFLALLRFVRDDRVTAISLSLAVPYLAFWTAEAVFHVSGIIAVVVAGVTLATLAPGRVTPEVWRHLRDTWEQLASWAAILIFVLTSLRVPHLMTDVGLFDLLLLVVLFVAALLARAVVLFGLLPLLTRLGLSADISRPYRLVVLWGGLRGSMTLALALAVTENAAIPPTVAAFVATLATGFTLMTLFVQGTTLRMLIQRLGLNRLTGVDRVLRDLAVNVTTHRVAKLSKEMASRFDGAGEAGPSRDDRSETDEPPTSAAISESERSAIALAALTLRERETVLEHFANGTVGPRIAQRLAADARRRLDMARVAGVEGYRAANREETEFLWLDRLSFSLQRRFGYSGMLSRRMAARFETLIETALVVSELQRFVDSDLRPVVGAETVDMAVEALRERAALIEREIDAVKLQYPAYVVELERAVIARSARALAAREISHLRRSGLINAEVERDVLLSFGDAGELSSPALDLGLNTRELIARCELFEPLSESHRDDLERFLRPFFAEPGMPIITRGEVGNAAYFILSGAVEIDTGTAQLRLGRGEIFGEMALLFDLRRQADVRAIAYSAMLRLSLADFQRFLALHPALRLRIETIARQRLDQNAAGAVPPAGLAAAMLPVA
jgi:CPA1 family monovalent cation:H+ antiporter